MQTFAKWLKDKRNTEMPKGDVDAGWFFDNDLPMIVECTCCQMTMALPNAYIDEDGHTYCSSCAGGD